MAHDRGFINVDIQMRTKVLHIFAIGDIVGQLMLANKAVHEGHVAAEVITGEQQGNKAGGQIVLGKTTSNFWILPRGASFQLVSPMLFLSASARWMMTSAAVCPWMAQCSLF